jgi:hypothetical protein
VGLLAGFLLFRRPDLSPKKGPERRYGAFPSFAVRRGLPDFPTRGAVGLGLGSRRRVPCRVGFVEDFLRLCGVTSQEVNRPDAAFVTRCSPEFVVLRYLDHQTLRLLAARARRKVALIFCRLAYRIFRAGGCDWFIQCPSPQDAI